MKTIRVDVEVPMTAEKVWAAITDQEQRREWFGGNYEIDPVEGGMVRMDLPVIIDCAVGRWSGAIARPARARRCAAPGQRPQRRPGGDPWSF